MIGLTFSQRVLDLALSIKPGEVSTYGDIAQSAGAGGQAARSVSGILGRFSMKGENNIPFHRIVYSNGQVWKSSIYDMRKLALYKKEKIEVDEKGFIINFERHRKKF
jgi:alkylated DNA nucleotide flippase Atl1